MAASNKTVDLLTKLIIRYVPRSDWSKFESELADVPGNASFREIAEKLIASLRTERVMRRRAHVTIETRGVS